MADKKARRIAVLWRGDRAARHAATPQNSRFHRIFEELAALSIHAEPAVFAEEFADEVPRAAYESRWRARVGRSDP